MFWQKNLFLYFCVRTHMDMSRECARVWESVRECERVCESVRECERVCESVRECARVWESVRWDEEFMVWGVQEMRCLWDGEFRRWGSLWDGEFTRWGVQEMGSLGDEEFMRWGVYEMGVQRLSYQGLTRAVFCVAKAQDTKHAAKQRVSDL